MSTQALAPLPPKVVLVGLPPLPEPLPGPVVDLAASLDSIPVVVRDFPDKASSVAAAAVSEIRALHPQEALDAYNAAWGALVVPSTDRGQVENEGASLVTASYGGVSSPGVSTPIPSLDRAINSLTGDARNADRLSNAAVALFALGIANVYGASLTEVNGTPTEGGFFEFNLGATAVNLLKSVDRAFPGNRAALLNLALFLSANVPESGVSQAIPPVQQVLAKDPGDRIARLLLASLFSRQPHAGDGVDLALRALAPLTRASGGREAALAQAAVGDAYLAAASIRQPEAPLTADHLARSAIDAYDRALGFATDAGLYAGRATASALLNAWPEAIAAQKQAVALAPEAIPFQLALANYQERTGDLEGMRETARAAFAAAVDDWDPSINQTRWLQAPYQAAYFTPGERGFLGYSVGSSRAPFGANNPGPQGGGFFVGSNLIRPIDDIYTENWRVTGLLMDVATQEAVEASALLGDENAALADTNAWALHLQTHPGLLGAQWGVDNRIDAIRRTLEATLLIKNLGLPPTDAFLEGPDGALGAAQSALRRVGRFRDAAQICTQAAQATGDVTFDSSGAWECAGENLYLAQDYEGAVSAFDNAGMLLKEAVARQALGQTEQTRRVLVQVAGESPESAAVALVQLGDMDLEGGDASAALAHYDLAQSTLVAQSARGDALDTIAISRATFLRQHAENNRGIALLRSLQTSPNAPPDCSGQNANVCRDARASFTAALKVDPRNQIYLLNLGWADRLLGDFRAARANLTAAAAVDPNLFPALNDLGVLAAERGETDAARNAFRAALAAAPDYALAAWNLGVLELRQSPSGILAGQAYLARAIRENPSLQHEKQQFRTDESIYRITFGASPKPQSGWAFGRGYSIVAVAFGSVALVSAAGAWFGTALFASAWGLGAEQLTRKIKGFPGFRSIRQRSQLLHARLGEKARWWMPWVATGVVLASVTAWSAWSANPLVGWSLVPLTLAITVWAVVLHELAHYFGSHRVGGKLVPDQWETGAVLGVLLAPIKLTSGPFPGERFIAVTENQAWWIHLLGPMTNLLLATGAWVLFQFTPLPLLLLAAQINLAVAAYSLLPNKGLDGHSLVAKRPGVAAILGFAVTAFGTVLALGLI